MVLFLINTLESIQKQQVVNNDSRNKPPSIEMFSVSVKGGRDKFRLKGSIGPAPSQ